MKALLGPALLLGLALGPAVRADTDPLTIAEVAADWQLAHPAAKYTALEWENAAFYAGLEAVAEHSRSLRFHEALVRVGEANGWQLGPRVYHADDQAVGQTYADLYRQSRDPRMIAPMKARFDHVLVAPPGDDLRFDPAVNPRFLDTWSWCDALFMAPPAFAKLTQATGDTKYLQYAVKRWWVTSAFLYDPTEHLYFRDSSYFARRERNGRKIFWSRGNGWVMAGLVRMLQVLPVDHPDRPRFLQQFREMAYRIAAVQSPDGFWRSSLLDPYSYPMQETSGTGFHTYALAWGLNNGVLDRATYYPVVKRAWRALLTCVRDDGELTHVQPVGATPVAFDPHSTEPFGVGAFLLAGTEVAQVRLTFATP